MARQNLYKILGGVLVVGVIAACVLMPSAPVPPDPARRHKPYEMCTANMAYLAGALARYEKDHGAFPPPYTVDENGKPLHSWRTLLLPYLDEEPLYEKIKHDEPWDSEHNRRFHKVDIPIFRCGSTKEPKPAGLCYYDVVVGEDTVFPPPKDGPVRTVDLLLSTSELPQIVLLVERKTPVPWMEPGSIPLESFVEQHGWRHEGGAATVIATADRKATLVDRGEVGRILRGVKK